MRTIRNAWLPLVTVAVLATTGCATAYAQPRSGWSRPEPRGYDHRDGAYGTGYDDGYRRGRDDARDRDRYDARGHREYRRGDVGYRRQYGPLGAYKQSYRAGFTAGYDEGYRDARRGGRGGRGGRY